MKKWILYAALALLVAVLITWFAAPHVSSTGKTIGVNGSALHVEIADTESSREQGLSGRASLAQGSGMLFVFPTDGRYAFWMKDMRFPLDILWLASDGTVVYILPNLSPNTYPRSYASQSNARYVLEVPAGYVQQHNVKIGDKVQL